MISIMALGVGEIKAMKPRFLIKIGGLAFQKQDGLHDLAVSIRTNHNAEYILLHGGGAEISQALEAAGRPNRFIDGIRVTHGEDIKIVEAVLSQTVNQRIADVLGSNGVACRRMSGKTRQLLIVEPLSRNGLNLGFVGRITEVNPEVVKAALAQGQVPVISPISADSSGTTYNVNADSAASALAVAADCTDLIFFTDVPGVMVEGQQCVSLTSHEARKLIKAGTIQGGMVAKIEAAFDALHQGVARVHILQWHGPQTLSRLICQNGHNGTTVCL